MRKNLITTDACIMKGLGKEHTFTYTDDPLRLHLMPEGKSKRDLVFTVCSDDLWLSITFLSTCEDIDIYFDPKKFLFEIESVPSLQVPSIRIECELINVFHMLGYFVSDTGFQLKFSKDGLSVSLDRKYLYTIYKENPMIDFTFRHGYPCFRVSKPCKFPEVGVGMRSHPPISVDFFYHLNPDNNKAVRGFGIFSDTIFPGVPIYSHLEAGYKDWETLHLLPKRGEKDILSVSQKWESFLEWDMDFSMYAASRNRWT